MYTPYCSGRLQDYCFHEGANKAMYEDLHYWRERARRAEGSLAYRDRMAAQHRRRRSQKRHRRFAERQRRKAEKKYHKTTEEVLLGIKSFADIVALGERKHELDRSVPQIRQLIAMIPGAKSVEKLVGLEEPKKHLFEVLMTGLLRRLVPKEHPLGTGFQNMVLLGPPGVGKTSLMQAFGEMCSAGGVTRRSKVTLAHRADMVGQYLGSTAVKTSELVKNSLGGILLIDEVYSLGSASNRDSFAKEAIDTLCGLIDKHRDDLIVVVAGYEDDVRHCFFAQNSGLERRFAHWIKLGAYTADELAEIFRRTCEDRGWHPTEGALQRLRERSKELTHNASDAVALATHLNLLLAHKIWAAAVPLPEWEVKQKREDRKRKAEADAKSGGQGPSKRGKADLGGTPLYVAISGMMGKVGAAEAKSSIDAADLQVAQVRPESLKMTVEAGDVDKALERLLQERERQKDKGMPPYGMYT